MWDANGQLVIYGELNRSEMVNNRIDNIPVSFDVVNIRSALIYFDTSSLQATAIKPIYRTIFGNGRIGFKPESFTVDPNGNYYASYTANAYIPNKMARYEYDTTKPKSYMYAFSNAGENTWKKQAEGFWPSHMYTTSGQLKIAGVNYSNTGYDVTGSHYSENQSSTSADVIKLTGIGDINSYTVKGGYGLGSIDIVVASLKTADGELQDLLHLGSSREEENPVMAKGFGNQLWVAGTVGNNIRNVPNITQTSYLVNSYKVPINGTCTDTYLAPGAYLRLNNLSSPLCIDSTYSIAWSSAAVNNLNIYYSTNDGLTYKTLASSVAASAGVYYFNAKDSGAVGRVKIKLVDVSGLHGDSADVNIYIKTIPTVKITASASTICSNTFMTYTATATNAGTSPVFRWKQNGKIVYTGNPFHAYPVNIGDSISVMVTSSTVCATPSVVSSNVIIVSPTAADAGNDTSICAGSSMRLGGTGSSTGTYSWTSLPAGFTSALANPVVNPSVTTKYYVTVTNGTCSAKDSITVTVNAMPVANAGPDKIICLGSAGTLIGSPAVAGNSYTWTPSTGLSSANIAQPTATNASSTAYTLTVRTPAGCIRSDSVRVDVDAPFTISLPDSSATVCIAQSLEIGLPTQAGYQYNWTSTPQGFTSNISNPTVSPLVHTSYHLKVTNAKNGCEATASIKVIADSCLTGRIAAYPNPARDEVTVQLDITIPEQKVIEFFNMFGASVAKKNFTYQTSVSVRGLTNGFYTYTIKTASGKLLKSGKIMVSH